MLRTAEKYLKEEMGIEMPREEISVTWFEENGLPMIVSCQCCHTRMALPSAMIDEDGNIFCENCAN